MTNRQKFLKFFYPGLLFIGKLFNAQRKVFTNTGLIKPNTPFHRLTFIGIDGNQKNLEAYKGKKILLVNTASDCGFTPQLKDLQQLQEQFSKNLVIIGFPSNDFKNQEKENNESIAAFCSVNFGVRFTLAQKSIVLKKEHQNSVFKWLTDQNENGWNNRNPTWNFTKYLINEDGILINVIDPGISPLDSVIVEAINETPPS